MKKIILLLFLFFFSGIGYGMDKSQFIYRIDGYEFDTISKDFIKKQHGSSVVLSGGRLLTNAHVVLGSDDEPLSYYMVCKSDKFSQIPVCDNYAKLLYYDVEQDLALLQIQGTGFNQGVEFAKDNINIGQTAHVFGYPGYGGETLTYTKGVIGGFSDGFYKIDANLDGGNSGGGVFDDNGRLIGIPDYLIGSNIGYSMLGYMISIDIVNKFISKGGNVIEFKNKIDEISFKEFVNRYAQASSNKYKLSDKYIKAIDLSLIGFRITDHVFMDSGKYRQYYISDYRSRTSAMFRINENTQYGKLTIDTLLRTMEGSYKQEFQKVSSKKVKISGMEFAMIKGVGTTESSNDLSIGFFSPTIQFVINSSTLFQFQVDKILNVFKSGLIPMTVLGRTSQVVIGDIKFKIKNGTSIIKSFASDGQPQYLIMMEDKKFTYGLINYQTSTDATMKDMTMEEYLNQVEIFNNQDYINIEKSGVAMTNNGYKYILQKGKAGSNNVILISFFKKIDDRRYTRYNFMFLYEEETTYMLDKIDYIINNFSLNGKLPFKNS